MKLISFLLVTFVPIFVNAATYEYGCYAVNNKANSLYVDILKLEINVEESQAVEVIVNESDYGAEVDNSYASEFVKANPLFADHKVMTGDFKFIDGKKGYTLIIDKFLLKGSHGYMFINSGTIAKPDLYRFKCQIL